MEHTVTKAKRWCQISWPGFALAAGSGFLIALALWMIVAQYPRAGFGQDASARSKAAFEAETGVRLLWVAVTAAGGMIDLRYQVVDPDKALIVHDQEKPPRLIDETTGRIISRPWMDHSHDRELHMAVTYHQLLMNAGGAIKRGRRVTIVIGDVRLEHVIVQ